MKISFRYTNVFSPPSFRLLKNAQNEVHFKIWYQKLLAALQFCAGKALNNEFSKEGKLIRILEVIAKKVKAASDPQRKVCFKNNPLLYKFFQVILFF